MTKTISMLSHKNHNLDANEGFMTFLTSKLIIHFIDNFTLKLKSQSIAYLLNGSKYIDWSSDLEGEVHSIWDSWISGRQDARATVFSKLRGVRNSFRSSSKFQKATPEGCSSPNLTSPERS